MFDEKVHVLNHPLLQHKLSILRREDSKVIVEGLDAVIDPETLEKMLSRYQLGQSKL